MTLRAFANDILDLPLWQAILILVPLYVFALVFVRAALARGRR